MTIEDWRSRIDGIDMKLLELLNERAECVLQVGKIKKDQRVRIFDPERERQIMLNLVRENRGPLDAETLQRIFERIIEECRRIEGV